MPMISNKHRQLANKKGSVNIMPDPRLINENDSQISGRQDGLGIKGQGQIRDHRGSMPPRIISRVRGENKVMQVYQNTPSNNMGQHKQSVSILYG